MTCVAVTRTGLGVLVAALLNGCVFDDRGSCDTNCTAILNQVSVTVVDAADQLVPRMATKTVYLPTGAVLHESKVQNDSGFYVVIDDALDQSLLLPRDCHELRFYAHSTEGTAMGDFVIRAGECVCHVEKLSGPDRLVLQPH